jgi:hypothetical protein
MFHHSLVSGWNHGVGDEWRRRGHEVVVHEPANRRSVEAVVLASGA